ncbi:MAG: ABC transporter permease [Actinomycetota bacterium]|nr:ABC transporter permease [Actinomycetota bacterium]
MITLIRAEFLKLRTTQVWFWLLLVSIAISALIVVASLASSNGVRTASDVPQMFASATTAYLPVFVLGVLGVTTEFRHQTITPTVLGTPSRWALTGAKMLAYAIVGAAYSLICILVQVLIALPWLSAKGIHVSVTGDHIPRALVGVFIVVALFGIVGIGVGALVRNQIAAVSIGLVFLLVLQGIIAIIPVIKYAYPYLPGGAAAAIVHTTGSEQFNNIHLLPAFAGGAVLLAWAVVTAVLGASITMNQDIT